MITIPRFSPLNASPWYGFRGKTKPNHPTRLPQFGSQELEAIPPDLDPEVYEASIDLSGLPANPDNKGTDDSRLKHLAESIISESYKVQTTAVQDHPPIFQVSITPQPKGRGLAYLIRLTLSENKLGTSRYTVVAYTTATKRPQWCLMHQQTFELLLMGQDLPIKLNPVRSIYRQGYLLKRATNLGESLLKLTQKD